MSFFSVAILLSAVCALGVQAQSSDNLTWHFFKEDDRERLVIVVTSGENDTFRDCYYFANKEMINFTLAMAENPDTDVEYVNASTIEATIKECEVECSSQNYTYKSGPSVFSALGFISALAIFPGTKYCGAGNISSGYDDLGAFNNTDACCRKHDSCPDYIEGFKTNHGLYNESPFTESNCVCDADLHACLQGVDSIISNLVGEIMFNVLQSKCFYEYYPILECTKSEGLIEKRCLEYSFNYSSDIVWEFFDAKKYTPESEQNQSIFSGIYDGLIDDFSP